MYKCCYVQSKTQLIRRWIKFISKTTCFGPCPGPKHVVLEINFIHLLISCVFDCTFSPRFSRLKKLMVVGVAIALLVLVGQNLLRILTECGLPGSLEMSLFFQFLERNTMTTTTLRSYPFKPFPTHQP